MSQRFLSETKARSVAEMIGPRLIEINKAIQAAQIYYSANMIRECIDAFISVDEFTKAEKVAEQFDADLVQYVKECYRNRTGDMDPNKALDICVQNKEWEKGLKLAEKQVSLVYLIYQTWL